MELLILFLLIMGISVACVLINIWLEHETKPREVYNHKRLWLGLKRTKWFNFFK